MRPSSGNLSALTSLLFVFFVSLVPQPRSQPVSKRHGNSKRSSSNRQTPNTNKTGANTYAIYGEPIEHFRNDGRLQGWDHFHHENDGKIKEINDAKRCFHSAKAKDDHCLSFQQSYDPDYRGRYHSEVIVYKAAMHHQASYYGMAFKLEDDFVFDEPWKKREKAEHIKIHIMQFIASFKDIDCGSMEKTAVPTTMIWLENDNIFTKVRFGDICHDRHHIKEFWIGTFLQFQFLYVAFLLRSFSFSIYIYILS